MTRDLLSQRLNATRAIIAPRVKMLVTRILAQLASTAQKEVLNLKIAQQGHLLKVPDHRNVRRALRAIIVSQNLLSQVCDDVILTPKPALCLWFAKQWF